MMDKTGLFQVSCGAAGGMFHAVYICKKQGKSGGKCKKVEKMLLDIS